MANLRTCIFCNYSRSSLQSKINNFLEKRLSQNPSKITYTTTPLRKGNSHPKKDDGIGDYVFYTCYIEYDVKFYVPEKKDAN